MISIRLGHPGDFAAIQAVERSASFLFSGTHMEWAVDQVTDIADFANAAGREMLWVAERDGELGGFLLAEACGADFHICEVSVGQASQGQGIGRSLMETALAVAVRQGFLRATLTTDRTLAWNAPWYERLGFKIIAPDSSEARLAARLASEPAPDRRCAMIRPLR